MKSYSQNKEDLIILNHLKGFIGTVVEFGANNGTDLSNSRLLIEKGFSGLLIEPSSVFKELSDLYKDNRFVTCLNVAISDKCGKMEFLESGCHVKNGSDRALVSTLNVNETKRWPDVEFKHKTVNVLDIKTLRHAYAFNWDVISIDVEGLDWVLLQQIDLNDVKCRVLCVEWNSVRTLHTKFTAYCAKFGMKEIHRNSENLIFSK